MRAGLSGVAGCFPVIPAKAGIPLLFLATPGEGKLDFRFRGNDEEGPNLPG
jgi:hypothetical protein